MSADAAAVCGIDFTSRPSRRKPITVAHGVCEGAVVRLDAIAAHAHFAGFAQWLNRPGAWVGAFDFPFGLPRELVTALGWPLQWDALIRHYAALPRAQIRATFAAYCAARPAGAKFSHRATDRPAGSSPSMKWVNPPVAYMLHAGVPLLIDAGLSLPAHGRSEAAGYPRGGWSRVPARPGAPLSLPGLRPVAGETRVALEGYPGLLARELIGRQSYKSDTRSKQTPERRAARETLVAALAQNRSRLGLALVLSDAQREELVADASGDRLDAVLCLLQAAWASQQPGHGLPSQVDPLEGWIVTA